MDAVSLDLEPVQTEDRRLSVLAAVAIFPHWSLFQYRLDSGHSRQALYNRPSSQMQ